MAPCSTRRPSFLAIAALVLALVLPATAAPPSAADEGDDAYRFLVGLVEKGLYDMAVDEARTFLRDHPRHEKATLARYRLATALFELERFEEAASEYTPLAKRKGFEYRAESTFRLGQCELSRERYREAKRAFQAVLEQDQDYLRGPATFLLGESGFRAGDVELAEKQYEELLARHPESEYVPAARRGLAWCAWEQQDFEATIRRVDEYLERHGDAEAADEMRGLQGEALIEAGRPADALRAFQSVRSDAFRDTRRRGAGFAYAAMGEHQRAAQEFMALVEEVPDSRFVEEAKLHFGVQMLRAGETGTAVRVLQSLASGNDPETLYWLAQAQLESGEPQAALAALDRALAANPPSDLLGRIQVSRGDALTKLGRGDAALAAYESGGSDYALYAAAVQELNEGDAESARRLIGKLFEAYPETTYRVEGELVRGEAAFAAQDFEAAERSFAAVLERRPEPEHAARALSRIAWCRYLTNDLAEAARGFEALGESHPRSKEADEALYMLARITMEAEQPKRARRFAAQYLQVFPRGDNREEVLLIGGRAGGDDARQMLEMLLAEAPESPFASQAMLELADQLSAAGELDRAGRRYAELLERHPRSEQASQARYGLAWCLYQGERYADSTSLLEAVGADESAEVALREAAWELCIWAHARAENPRGAQNAWRRFAQLSKDDGERFDAARTVAAAWRDAGKPQQAKAVLDELLSQIGDPSVAIGVLVEGAYLALEEGDVDRADAQVQVAQRRAPESADVLEASFYVGEARYAREEDARAAELYRQAARTGSPVAPQALYKLGFTLLRAEDSAGAGAAFEKLVNEHPQSELRGEALFLLGEARFREKDYQGSAQALVRLLDEEREHEVVPKALFRLGVALGHLERWPESEVALTRLARDHEEFPNLAEAELWRGRALAAQKKNRPARQAFERVVGMDRGELAARARLGLGRLAQDEGRTEEALSEFLKVAVLYAHDAEVAEALFRAGGCLEELGDTEKAREQYRELVEKHPRSRFVETSRERLRALKDS